MCWREGLSLGVEPIVFTEWSVICMICSSILDKAPYYPPQGNKIVRFAGLRICLGFILFIRHRNVLLFYQLFTLPDIDMYFPAVTLHSCRSRG